MLRPMLPPFGENVARDGGMNSLMGGLLESHRKKMFIVSHLSQTLRMGGLGLRSTTCTGEGLFLITTH